MVNEEHREILDQILGLLDSACEANLALLEQYAGGNSAVVEQLLTDLGSVVRVVGSAQEVLLPQLEHAYTTEMLENVEDTLEDIRGSIAAGDADRAGMKMEFQLFPFLRQLREAFYFWGAVYPDEEAMSRYYQEDFSRAYQNYYVQGGEPSQIQLSIVVTGYNHLEMTKQCIAQLLEETDFEKLNAELILIDHGSTDGTLEYFESLGMGKVIHFKNNVRTNMFAALFQMCQGKYFCFVSNDILVTRNWADILLHCLDSDERIIAAVPATPNVANLQTTGLPDLGPQEYLSWAKEHNKPDPTRWEDRSRLMPPVGMYRTEAVNRVGFADPYLYSMEFWDDDFSLRARRAGYRQILCGDVACYHFGSVTGKEGQKTEGTLAYGRELFRKKHGIDAWGPGFCYNYTAVQLFKRLALRQERVDILGLDCGMGDTLLQIRNVLRQTGQEGRIWQLASQKTYLPDMEPLSYRTQFLPELVPGIGSAFAGQEFAFVWIERDIAEYEDSAAVLEAAAARLSPDGYLLFTCGNPFYAVTLHMLLHFSIPEEKKRYILADPMMVQQQAERCFSQVQVFPARQEVGGLEEFARQHYQQAGPELLKRIAVEKYYFLCRK